MTALGLDAVSAILIIPATAAGLLALLPGYRLTARINVLAAFLTLLAALSLLAERPAPGPYLLVDDTNIVFIVLGSFVGFTTSVFSATYIAHELETGRLTPAYLRFYHAMYQMLMFAMNLALASNSIGLMWVAIELATLTTVLMVGIYRTHEALEAAWKYFILGSVGIALALFGTILVYMAARPVIGEGADAMVWTTLIEHASGFSPELLNVAFVFLLLGYGTKVGLARKSGADDQELAHEDAERWEAGDRDDAKHETPAKHGVGFSESSHVGDFLRALGLRDMTDRKEDR